MINALGNEMEIIVVNGDKPIVPNFTSLAFISHHLSVTYKSFLLIFNPCGLDLSIQGEVERGRDEIMY